MQRAVELGGVGKCCISAPTDFRPAGFVAPLLPQRKALIGKLQPVVSIARRGGVRAVILATVAALSCC